MGRLKAGVFRDTTPVKCELGVNSPVPLSVWAATVMNPTKPETQVADEGTTRMSRDTLSITDNRTGKVYEVPIKNDTIHATDLRQIKVKPDDFGMMSYDPAFNNTALCQSKITYIDGDKGILRYRGYSIEELAEKSTYLETAYLILRGELPTRSQLEEWTYHVTHHTFIHESVKKFLDGFHYDAHPMGMMISLQFRCLNGACFCAARRLAQQNWNQKSETGWVVAQFEFLRTRRLSSANSAIQVS